MFKALILSALACCIAFSPASAASADDVQVIIRALVPDGTGGVYRKYMIPNGPQTLHLTVFEGILITDDIDTEAFDKDLVDAGLKPFPRGRVFSLDVSDGQCMFYMIDEKADGTLTHWGSRCMFSGKRHLALAPSIFGPDEASAQKVYDGFVKLIRRHVK